MAVHFHSLAVHRVTPDAAGSAAFTLASAEGMFRADDVSPWAAAAHIPAPTLTIHGERREEQHDKHHSEVRYGSFSRQFQLPKGCKSDDVSATYSAGVLQVSLPVGGVAAEPTRIPIAHNGE